MTFCSANPTDCVMRKSSKPTRGGKRAGSGRKPGAKNKSTLALKEYAGQFSQEAVQVLVEAMRDTEAPPAVRIQAADKLLDRSHGKPAVHLEPVEVNITPIPWEELREIRKKSMEEAERKHREMIEGRYERLGIKRDYHSD
jgi:hypothetical protein